MVTLSPHDMFTENSKDRYPPSLKIRADCPLEILAGIIDSRAGICVDFLAARRFLVCYNTESEGSQAPMVVLTSSTCQAGMCSRSTSCIGGVSSKEKREQSSPTLEVLLPSLNKEETVPLFMGSKECGTIVSALESMPWAHVSWSMQR